VTSSLRIVAIDWSGAKNGGAKKIWRADVIDGELVSLVTGRTRNEVGAQLIADASTSPNMIVGCDFSFSLPAWFLQRHGLASATELWRRAADGLCERWLASCDPPFWGRRGSRRPPGDEVYRRTEVEVFERTGFRPMSTFQIAGAGAPGTASLRGMPVLHMLHEAGFAIWPFDPAGLPSVLEIYPRVFTGRVTKTDPAQRVALAQGRYPALRTEHLREMWDSDDAFDAGVAALEMYRWRRQLTTVTNAVDPIARLEGAIWCPNPEHR
jgi:hypothetical protein